MSKHTQHSLISEKSSVAPVTCLGQSFDSQSTCDAAFRDRLQGWLESGDKRGGGFPSGDVHAVVSMSDPPFYTACPNPFLSEFVKHFGRPYDPASDTYRRAPFTADVSEGKSDPIYTAHAYHTKVPHKAIIRYILHYTNPGDIVLDGFCGTGMTGVAAQLCGDRSVLSDMGYVVGPNGSISEAGQTVSQAGPRRAVLNDLSPAATFIAFNYNVPAEMARFESAAAAILKEVADDLGWMYETLHKGGKTKGRINYTVWSECFICPECSKEVVFTREALNQKTGEVREEFPCPHCGVSCTKSSLVLLYESVHDKALNRVVKLPKRIPVLINYNVGKEKFEKEPDENDLATLRRVRELRFPTSAPVNELPDMQMRRVGRMQPAAITHLHHFFLDRPLHAMSALWAKASQCSDDRTRQMLLFFVEQAIWGMSVLARYVPTHFSQVNQYLSGVFYVASQVVDTSPWYILDGKLKRLSKAFGSLKTERGQAVVSTGDLAALALPDNCIDYVFTDPPFGENIYYSDLNLLVESWHRVTTAVASEAIVDRVKGKGLSEYQELMERCFGTYHRVLKPGRWLTIEFHNSRNSVWNAIQEALQRVGFVVADVRTLDKKQGSFQQIVSGNTVKRDLIISAYKPATELEEKFKLKAGTEAGMWEFVTTHLRQLPVYVKKEGKMEPVAERQSYLLFDRMVAFHVQRGVTVPFNSAEFHAGLDKRYPKRDGMYFLLGQVSEYDRKRLDVKQVEQLELFVNDEKSAILWVRQQLAQRPMKYQELQPLYMQEAQRVWEKHEKPIELQLILQENFVNDGGKWRQPDPSKEGDLEQLRSRALLKEYELYRQTKGKLKVVRTEALRAGFKDCWQSGDYKAIVEMAKRLPEQIIQDDQTLLMYYDNALMRTEG